MKKDSEVLECAAKLLEEKGWIQHSYRDDNNQHCVVGAVAVCKESFMANGSILGYPASNILRANEFPVINGSCSAWNDDPSRTKEEVIAALLSAAEVARQKESA